MALFFLSVILRGGKMAEQVGDFLVRKVREPSTWKGLGWLLVAAGLVPVGAVDLVVSAGVGLVGLVEIIRRETR
jgi:hypothetical protein